jgi:hypothetical protein
MNDIEAILDAISQGRHTDVKLHKATDKMLILWNSKKPMRFGLHLSDITLPFEGKTQFCYRQHVLGKFYLPAEERPMAPKALAIFLEGWYVHLKWQMLFKLSGNAVEIEKTRLDPVFGIYHTPDVIAKFPEIAQDDLWIVEIKSMGMDAYNKVAGVYDPYKIHPSGYKQAQLYMYLVGCKKAMLLLENKNNQDRREVSFDYDPDFIAPYIHRLNTLSQMWEEKTLPMRVCENSETNRALSCNMRNVCWVGKKEREKFLLTTPWAQEQVNASLIHFEE